MEIQKTNMMKLNNLPKTTNSSKKRLGRGYGSGKGGHTVGRGAKGFKARNKVDLLFEGTKIKKSLLKRLPLTRGKGKLKPKRKPLVVNIKYLNLFSPKTTVDIDALIKKNIVKKNEAQDVGVKILGDGDLKIPLEVTLPCSHKAQKKIEKAGGKVTIIKENQKKTKITTTKKAKKKNKIKTKKPKS